MFLGCRLQAPAILPLGNTIGTHCTGGWVGPWCGEGGCVNFRHHWDSIPELSSLQLFSMQTNRCCIYIDGTFFNKIRKLSLVQYITSGTKKLEEYFISVCVIWLKYKWHIYIACLVPFLSYCTEISSSNSLTDFFVQDTVHFTVYALCSNIPLTGYVILPIVPLLLTVSAYLFVITVNCNADLTYSSVQVILKKIIECHPVPDLLFIGHELSWSFTVTAL